MLFPTRSGADNRVQRLQEKVFPSPNGFFRFDSRPGNIRLLLMIQATAGSDAPAQQMAASREDARPTRRPRWQFPSPRLPPHRVP